MWNEKRNESAASGASGSSDLGDEVAEVRQELFHDAEDHLRNAAIIGRSAENEEEVARIARLSGNPHLAAVAEELAREGYTEQERETRIALDDARLASALERQEKETLAARLAQTPRPERLIVAQAVTTMTELTHRLSVKDLATVTEGDVVRAQRLRERIAHLGHVITEGLTRVQHALEGARRLVEVLVEWTAAALALAARIASYAKQYAVVAHLFVGYASFSGQFTF